MTLVKLFSELPDYRKTTNSKFNVGEVLFLSMLSVLSGCEGYKDMELWIKERKRELVKLLGHFFVAPAYTSIRNVFLNIDIEHVNEIFEKWSHTLANTNGNENAINIIASDGKTMRGSKDRIKDENAKHIVSLFLAQDKITLAQTPVDNKSNEIPALLELLNSLKMENCVITVDALHTQKKL